MLKISKIDNSIVIEGINNNLYPNNGTVTFPLNSIVAVLDESNIVTFKSAANADVLFSGKIEDITINDETVTKEDVLNKFNTISNAPMGGEKIVVDSELSTTSENPLQNKVITTELDKKLEKVELTQDEYNALPEIKNNVMYVITDALPTLSYIKLTKAEYDQLTDKQEGVMYIITDALPTLSYVKLTKAEYDQLTDKQEGVMYIITDAPKAQEELVSGVNIKTINNLSILGEGNLDIQGGAGGVTSVNGEKGDVVINAANLNVPTNEELNAALANKVDNTAITDMATQAWVNSKNYATVSQLPNIEGKLDITVYDSEKANFATKAELNAKADSTWVTEQINAAIAQVNQKITEINNKIV